MRKTLLQSIYDAFTDYGYDRDEVDEIMHELLVKDDIEVDIQLGTCLSTLTAEWLRVKKYSFHRDEFSFELIRPGDVDEWAKILKLLILDCTRQEARRWAEASIRYVISPKYWRDATISYGPSYYLHKGAKNCNIPIELIAEIVSTGYDNHYGRDFDEVRRLIKEQTEW